MGSENVFQENQEYLIKARELVVAIDDVQRMDTTSSFRRTEPR